MKELLFNLIKSGNGWFRMLVGIVVGVWMLSGMWTTLKQTLKSHEERITKLEFVMEQLPQLLADVRDRLPKRRQ